MHWMYRSVQRRQKGEIDWFKIAACCRFGDKCFRTAAEQREILVRDLETDLLFLQPQERLRNNTVYIWEWPKFNPAFIRTLGSWYELKAATAAKIPTLTQSTFFCFVSVEWLLSTLPPSRRKQTLINEVVKEINPLMKTVYKLCICVSLCTQWWSWVQEACEPAVVEFLHPPQFSNLSLGHSGGCRLGRLAAAHCRLLLRSCPAGFNFLLWILFLFLALHFLLGMFTFLSEAMRSREEKKGVNVTLHIFWDKQRCQNFPMCPVLDRVLSRRITWSLQCCQLMICWYHRSQIPTLTVLISSFYCLIIK